MQSSGEWLDSMAAQIGRGIDRARRGRSDQWIADRTEQLGHPLSRTAVSEYRRGKRKTISVTDLFVIAGALGVPPVTIVFPGLPDGRVHLLPVVGEVAALDALQWATGERQTFPDGFDVLFSVEDGEMMGHVEGRREYRGALDYHGGEYDLRHENDHSPEMQLLSACRELVDAFQDVHKLDDDPFMAFRDALSPEQQKQTVDRYLEMLGQLTKQVEQLEKRIKDLGGELSEEEVTQYGEADDNGTRSAGD